MARIAALDRLRAIAVVSMIQGHTFTALMAQDALPAWFMGIHGVIHGLTAPAFLFGSGLAFGVATYPKYAQHREAGSALLRRLRRYATLLLLGYALQLPGSSVRALFREMTQQELALVLRIGPLHLIALCLTLCQLAALAFKSREKHALASSVLGLAIMVLAPFVYGSDLSLAMPAMVAPWLDARTGSLFPIFPWASFVFFGVGCAALLVRAEPVRPRMLALVGSVLVVATYAMFYFGVRLAPKEWFWHASPLNVVFRLGAISCLFAALHFARDAQPAKRSVGSLSAFLAQHSLVAYVAHLLLIYGTPFTPNLHYRIGPSMTAVQALLTFLAIGGLTFLIMHAFVRLSRESERGWVRVGFTLMIAAVFVRG